MSLETPIDTKLSTSALDMSLARLERAVDRVGGAVTSSKERQGQVFHLKQQMQKLVKEKAMLAADLKDSNARANRLKTANLEVSRRLEEAMGTVHTVLRKHGG